MSELRFTCPSCGQHMQCEKAYGGDKTTCPACAAEMIIPFSHTPPEPGTSLPHAELILKPGDTTTMLSKKTASAGKSDIPMEITVGREPENPKPPSPTEAESDVVRCICPVCQSELKVSATPTAPFGTPIVAEVVQPAKPEPAPVSSDAHGESPPAGSDESPAIQRERQIAAAREAHQVTLYPAMKPRLSYVLSGERPGPSEPKAPAAPAQSDPKSDDGPGVKTLNE